LLAAVERKSLDNLASTLSDGSLVFQLERLAELPLAAVVVESRYGALFKLEHVSGALLADQLRASKSATPASRSSSLTHAATPRTGPTASSPP
jgi:ERCC4-type nuclease